MFDLVFKLGATYGDIKGVLPIEYVKLCVPFIFLSCCRLFVGSGVSADLHASVDCHSNNFVCPIYYVKVNFIRFDLVVNPCRVNLLNAKLRQFYLEQFD